MVFLTRDLIIGLGSIFFNQTFTCFYNFNMLDSEFLPALIKNIPFMFTILGAFLSLLLINGFLMNTKILYSYKIGKIYRFFYTFLNKK